MKHIHQPYVSMEMLSRTEVQQEESYWKSLRNKIKEKIINDITDLFLDLKESEKITAKTIDHILFNPNIYRSALNHITDNIELDNLNKVFHEDQSKDSTLLEKLEQTKIELTFSYFYDISIIQKSMKKDAENIYTKEYQQKIENILKQNNSNLYIKNETIKIFGQILDEILEKFVNRKSGIYLSIQKKFDLLSKTLLK